MNFGNFIPHGYCLAWDPGLVWLQAASDVTIAVAYYSIPAALVVFLRMRRDLAFRPIFGLFAAFILACGTTHMLAVITLFAPVYWTDGVVKALTAALSIATAVMLWPLLPKALALPSPSFLSTLNARLSNEIEERDQTNAKLRDSEQRLRDLYARSPAILHATDNAGVLVEVSQRWLDLFGTTREQAVGRSMKEFYAPGTMPEFAEHVQDLLGEPGYPMRERRIRLATGEFRDIETVYALERDARGELQRILAALTDVTPRKQAEAALRDSEERLRHAQKMEAVGQLTGGIAHDFNNLLTAIMASLELLQQRSQLDERGQRLSGAALEGARRAARLTSQLLSFSRRSRLAPESLDPEATILGIAQLLTQTAGPSIQLSIARTEPATWPIMADRNQVESAVLNLVINARDAIGARESIADKGAGGGTGAGEGSIRIGFENRAIGGAEAAGLHPDPVAPGDYVALTIADNGAGMSQAVLDRATEPFFTTKPPGAGSGLGLSQTYGFATQSGGALRLRSAPGHGTTVEILLPRAITETRPKQGPAPEPGSAGRGETIVLAEDDALLRQTIGDMLRTQGYDVETAANARAALALLERLPRVDLLLTDVMMPGGMNGVELARAARVLLPALRVVFATGFSDQKILAQWTEELDVVNKPFTLQTLTTRIAASLRANRVAPDQMA